MTIEPMFVGLFGIILFIVLLAIGVRLAFAAAVTGFIGMIILKGWDVGITILGTIFYGETVKYGFSVIPLFILMGYIVFGAGLTSDMYRAARAWFGRLPGGLAIATVFGSAGFGGVSGSSTAASAIFSKAAIPEMKKYGYAPTLAAGVVAAGGTLAFLIPPSTVIIVYAVLTETSVGACLIGGIIPGVVSAVIYSLMIGIRAKLNPRLAPPVPSVSWGERIQSLSGGIWLTIILFLFVIGGLFFGIFTPTEAGAAGVFGALVIGLISRRLNWTSFRSSLMEAGQTTVMVLITIVGTLVFIRLLALSGVSSAFISFVLDLDVPRIIILLGILLIFLILGMFVTAVSMLVLVLPLAFPVIVGLGYDPIWFCILAIKMCEIGIVTPPVGLNCYVVNNTSPEISLPEVFKGVIPFLMMDFTTVALLIAVPQIILFLPNLMYAPTT